MRSERGLSTIQLHCLQWYKLVLRARLPTPAVQYLVHTSQKLARLIPRYDLHGENGSTSSRSLASSCKRGISFTHKFFSCTYSLKPMLWVLLWMHQTAWSWSRRSPIILLRKVNGCDFEWTVLVASFVFVWSGSSCCGSESVTGRVPRSVVERWRRGHVTVDSGSDYSWRHFGVGYFERVGSDMFNFHQ